MAWTRKVNPYISVSSAFPPAGQGQSSAKSHCVSIAPLPLPGVTWGFALFPLSEPVFCRAQGFHTFTAAFATQCLITSAGEGEGKRSRRIHSLDIMLKPTHKIYLASAEEQNVAWLSPGRLPRRPAGARGRDPASQPPSPASLHPGALHEPAPSAANISCRLHSKAPCPTPAPVILPL